jgi:hypothetical protein
LQAFRRELEEYARKVKEFEPIGDLRLHLQEESQEQQQELLLKNGGFSLSSSSPSSSLDFCKLVDLHADGIQGLFPSGQLSQMMMMMMRNSKESGSGSSSRGGGGGFVEPLLPPMRHPAFCDEGKRRILDLTYLVHDFGALCRKLKRHSRIVLFDMGASLNYHDDNSREDPITHLINLFTKFGFPFDHIYAYEIKHRRPPLSLAKSCPWSSWRPIIGSMSVLIPNRVIDSIHSRRC